MKRGIYLALITAFISGLSVFLNKFALSFWTNSSVFTTAKNLIVALFLTSLIIFLKKYSELKTLSKKDWLQLVIIGIIGGSIPFLLFFKALTFLSATTGAFIHKTLFIWVAILAVPILKEKLSKIQIAGLGILILGTFLFSWPIKLKFGLGELLMFLAVIFWAVENIIAKIALRNISPLIAAWGRMFFGSGFLLGYLYFTGEFEQLFVFSPPKIGWLVFLGILLFGYVLTWYSSLKYAPTTVVSSVLTVGAPLTAFLDAVFIKHQIKPIAILSILIIALGIILIIRVYERTDSFLQIRLSS
jgi:drug/metabolite transporter (DMT)-like permease